ncbi:MAG TPA: ABC transporter ATP-binding protein [bacterium]|nr:ABC transporter ATP-binding protein [bacterium]
MRVVLEHLSKRFGPVIAVDDISLTVGEGELVALLGPSGCGKSTALFLVAGLYRPSAGRILFGDRVVNDVPPQNRGVGMMFQSYALYPHLTVFENIAFPLRVKRLPAGEVSRRVHEVAALAGITEVLPRRPGQLSGGQQQRVALCRALVKAPAVLLLDEPLSNLDARLREVTRAEIKRLQRELRITTLFVSHDQAEALGIADRVGVMQNGKLVAVMTPGELYDHPPSRFVAEFIGTPPMNFLQVQVADGRLTFGSMVIHRLSRPVLPGGYVLGIRPEHLRIAAQGELHAEVMLAEPMGREVLIHALCGEAHLRILADARTRVMPGQSVRLQFEWEQAHLFDPENGTVVPLTVSQEAAR